LPRDGGGATFMKSEATQQPGGGVPPDEKPFVVSAPAINLPKGGGALRGIGEKFAANPVTGTGATTVPIAVSPGRAGFGPQLSLAYDSGNGNGPFGFGWALSLPAITRKTDKGLPRYLDAEESDVFVLAGSEDLVPWLRNDNTRFEDAAAAPGYVIHRYRPRVEGAFTRIERWTRNDGDVHWRSISRDNVLSIYGRDAGSRIVDPADDKRVFKWLISETRDDKGNAILYDYKTEDGTNADLTRASERNRGAQGDPRRSTNRYLKHIYYGNRVPVLDDQGRRPRFLTDAQRKDADWMFEVVLDYGEHDQNGPRPDDAGAWPWRIDPFSSYRAGFEIRTARLCRRVLMFHHFGDEAEVGNDCLVRSTEFAYTPAEQPPADGPIYSFLRSAVQAGYRRQAAGGYLKRSLPRVEFTYSEPVIQNAVQEVDPASLVNIPIGVDGAAYQWVDLHGEGIPGILTEQAGAWYYKRNLSPIAVAPVEFGPIEVVFSKPNVALAHGAQVMDLAGDGQPDVVVLTGPTPGLYEHDDEDGWQPFRPFASALKRDTKDPNVRFVDLDGDGRPDVLITEHDAFVWHPSEGEDGFGPARRVYQALDEEQGPRLVFSDQTQSIHLADVSGDGLADLVRIRNGEVCYWPNLGYGRFGAKITMDGAPQFDNPDRFDQRRLRLADIDGTGSTDIVYLHPEGVRLYFNQSGGSWSGAHVLAASPRVDDLADIACADLLGNGTTCLVWSSPLPLDGGRQMRFVDLMGGQKPHLLVQTVNNLGAETRVSYVPSTKFYLQDQREGRPWLTRLPFPVHVVERTETYDAISGNRFVTRYRYHDGHFDGEEREFAGFGMVEQWDTEEFATLVGAGLPQVSTNLEAASHVPPVVTRTWFHTGAFVGRNHMSDFRAAQYYREPGLTDEQARERLLTDTVVPNGLTVEEEREACRALKGSIQRQEIYAQDGSAQAAIPYLVTEQSLAVRVIQARRQNRHGVFYSYPSETLTLQYERNPADPRTGHALTLSVDEFGNVLRSVVVAYGRRNPDPALTTKWDQAKQGTTLVTRGENSFTNAIDQTDIYRTPLPAESATYQLTGFAPTGAAGRFQGSDFARDGGTVLYEADPPAGEQRRPIENVRTLYRTDDLSGLSPLGMVEVRALSGESYKLAFTPGLLSQAFNRPREGQAAEDLLPDPTNVLGGQGADRGGYVRSQDMKAAGAFPASDPDDCWWVPSGRSFYSSGLDDTAAQELTEARDHFFQARRFSDPFGATALVQYDRNDLLAIETRDAVGNCITVGQRDAAGNVDPNVRGNDYRVLQPRLVTDPNRNRIEITFDALGLVAGTAVKGKDDTVGDTLNGFVADLTELQIDGFYDALDPHVPATALLGEATTRVIYDFDRFAKTRAANPSDPTKWLAPFAASLARETHVSDPAPGAVHISFSYSDGFGREIQRKVQAEGGPVVDGGPVVSPRWVGSGWTVYNNKGNPVRRFEPFFSQLTDKGHRFEFGIQIGVSPIAFYDPLQRVVATLHPNHTYEKVVFDAWQETTYDVNDTVAASAPETGDPETDPHIGGLVAAYLKAQPKKWETWYDARSGGGKGVEEESAAEKAKKHANTPTVMRFDTLGRTFMTVVDAGVDEANAPQHFVTRADLDIEGNQREVRDASVQAGDPLGRIILRCRYDMLGNHIRRTSMEGGERWTLNDVLGNPIRTWDSRGHACRREHDPLRRLLRVYVTGADPASGELLTERLVYGEQHPEDEQRNLRTRVYLHLDQAGGATNETFDFKGNTLQSSRRLAKEYTQAIGWSVVDAGIPLVATSKFDAADLEAKLAPRVSEATFVSRTSYDALNRATQKVAPRTELAGSRCNVLQFVYNEASLLKRIDVWLAYGQDPAGLIDATVTPASPVGVANIEYDAKGQRLRIEYKNHVVTRYRYDPETLRLSELYTRRGAAYIEDCENPTPPPQTIAAPDAPIPSCGVQNLHYFYDPAGNITHVRDDAQQTIYFRNKRVEPSADYEYDALYRLTRATGREHLGQIGGAPIVHSWNDEPRVGIEWSANDGRALGTYREEYAYDAVGNLRSMRHVGADPVHPGWTRTYTYNETSLIEDGTGALAVKSGNRLSQTAVTGNPSVERYLHDAHGNMVRMPHLASHPDPTAQNMHWDYRDRLRQVDLGGGGTAYHIYGANGERTRKLWRKAQGGSEERIYVGDFEVFRRSDAAGTVTLVRETLHIRDDLHRIAIVETRTQGVDAAPSEVIRYQHGNHLGSSCLELDDQAAIVSYEEYFPFGSTAYQAVRSQTETPKRYRYTARERDEESGLEHHGARYYAPWLARWSSSDPMGLMDGPNLYAYAGNNPLVVIDPSGHGGQSPASIAEAGYREALIKRFSSVGTVIDITPVKDVNAPGVDAHIIVIRDKEVISVLGDNKHANVPTKSGGSKTFSGTVSSFENAAKGEFRQIRQQIAEAQASGKVTAAQAAALTEQAKDGVVLYDVGLSGYNVELTAAARAKNSAGATVFDSFAEATKHRDSLNVRKALRGPNAEAPAAGTAAAAPPKPTAPVAAEASAAAAPEAAAATKAAAAPVPTAPEAAVAGAESKVARVATGTLEGVAGVAKGIGFAVTVIGAYNEANATAELERRNNRGWMNEGVMWVGTFALGVAAGAVDDALAVEATALSGSPAPVMDSWESYGAGPIQHVAGEAVRTALDWGARHGL
jgi:RHS repeat-associated protein